MRVTILRNEDPVSSKKWEQSCKEANIEYLVVDLTVSDWYEKIINDTSDCFLFT